LAVAELADLLWCEHNEKWQEALQSNGPKDGSSEDWKAHWDAVEKLADENEVLGKQAVKLRNEALALSPAEKGN